MKKNILAISLATLVAAGACKKKEEVAADINAKYIFALRTQGDNNESTDYVIPSESVTEGTASAEGTGIEQEGWCYYAQHNNTVFSIGYGNKTMTGYTLQDGKLSEKGSLILQEDLDCWGYGDDNTMVGIDASWGGGTFDALFYKFNPNSISITNSFSHNIYMPAGDTLHKWPTGMIVRNDKLFVPFYCVELKTGTWKTLNPDTAYIAVYSYPGMSFEKVIKDTRTANIGAYGNQPASFKTENGDIYTLSSGSKTMGFSPASTKPSGILRVNNGETEFDNSYFLNFDELTGGKKITTAIYAGNGKLVARMVDDAGADTWDGYSTSNYVLKAVVVDLINQTVTNIDDIPSHGGQYASPGLVENGKVYISVATENNTWLYEVDPATATAKKTVKVEGKELQGIYKIN